MAINIDLELREIKALIAAKKFNSKKYFADFSTKFKEAIWQKMPECKDLVFEEEKPKAQEYTCYQCFKGFKSNEDHSKIPPLCHWCDKKNQLDLAKKSTRIILDSKDVFPHWLGEDLIFQIQKHFVETMRETGFKKRRQGVEEFKEKFGLQDLSFEAASAIILRSRLVKAGLIEKRNKTFKKKL